MEILEQALQFLVFGLVVVLAVVGVAAWIRWRTRRHSLARELASFLGRDPFELPVVSHSFSAVDLPNLELALENHPRARQRPRVIGYLSGRGAFDESLRELFSSELGPFVGARLGPVKYRQVDVDVDRQLQCVENGIHLIEVEDGRVAAHVHHGPRGLELEVLATPRELAGAFIEDVRGWLAAKNVYRCKVISLECGEGHWGARGVAQVRFHRLPVVRSEEIILPRTTMDVIERNTVRFFRNAPALRRGGRSLKRGLLFHGRPGTGKTYTARWLAGSLDGVTVILLSAEQLWMVKECCQMARMLAPALVIMEDVDLIARPRSETLGPAAQMNLHQLLNEMDGLDSESEVIFVLTTNRPESIEPALAARPGRVDQAIEFPLPDAACRERLFDLYGRGLDLELEGLDGFVRRTEGASPAFIKELLRKAALFAAEDDSLRDGKPVVRDAHVDSALRELVIAGGEVTRNLLGFPASESQ